MAQRSEPRVAKHASVRIFGMDSRGNPINVPATTIDVSKRGARLSGVRYWDSPGETIGMRYGTEKARYRVVWIGMPHTPIDGQIGLQCVETGKNIWDFALPSEVPQMSSPMGDLPLTRALGNHVGLARSQYHDRRRRDPRFIVQGGANIREAGKDVPHWTMLHDLSLGGCYVETTTPLPEDSRVDITIQVGDVRIDARGAVTAKHPLVGMGIQFLEMSPVNRERLRHLIVSLEQSQSASTGR